MNLIKENWYELEDKEDIKTVPQSASTRIFHLDSKKMKTWKDLFLEFEEKMEFPDYFGRNIAALDECLADLGWIKEENYTLVFANPCAILASESESDFEYFFKFLDSIANEWKAGTLLGANWERPSTDFKIILQGPSSCTEKIKLLVE